MSPRGGGGGGGGRRKWRRALGKDEVVVFTFFRYRRIRDGDPSTGTRRAMGYFLYKRGVAAAQPKGGYNGRRGYGDKTTFGRTRSGRHKYAKASRRRELKGAVRLLDQNDELVR